MTGASGAQAGGRSVWTPARLRLWLGAAIVAAWLPLLGVPFRGWLDFAAFHAAGRLAFTPDVTSLRAVALLQAADGLPQTPFVYPAGLALLYAPFGALPYGLAAALHVALMALALGAAAWFGAPLAGLPRRWALAGAFAWAPAAASVASGQNATLALLLCVLAARALAAGQPFRAGLWSGLLLYKPQLGAPLAGLAFLRGAWAMLGGIVVVGLLHYAAGVLATGGRADWPLAWLATIRDYQAADMAANGWQAIGLPALGDRLAGVTGLPVLLAAGWVAGAAIVVACLPALRRLPPVPAVALAAACGIVVGPHAWTYDATLLLPALAVLAGRVLRGETVGGTGALVLAWALALAWPIGGLVGLTPLPLVVVAVPFALLGYGPFRQGTGGPAGPPGQPEAAAAGAGARAAR